MINKFLAQDPCHKANVTICAVKQLLYQVSEEDLFALDKSIGEALAQLETHDSTKRLLALDRRVLLRMCIFTRRELQTRLMPEEKSDQLHGELAEEILRDLKEIIKEEK